MARNHVLFTLFVLGRAGMFARNVIFRKIYLFGVVQGSRCRHVVGWWEGGSEYFFVSIQSSFFAFIYGGEGEGPVAFR